MQHVKQRLDVLLITPLLRGPDIFDNDFPNALRPVLLLHEIFGESARRRFRQMLMLGYGQDLVSAKTGKGDHVLDREHGEAPISFEA
jgi:hypothetical protein